MRNFLRRRKDEPSEGTPKATAATATGAKGPGVPFEAMTEEWRLSGRMLVEGRLSDALNRRQPIDLVDVQWAPIDGSSPLAPAPGIKSVDPYDLVLVIAGEASLPWTTDAERAAHKVHKITYEVGLEIPPFRVTGTLLLYPGYEPGQLLQRQNEMFVPIVRATATMGDRMVSGPDTDAILINRAYLRGVEQVDARTGERYEKLPGGSLGGAQWTDKTR